MKKVELLATSLDDANVISHVVDMNSETECTTYCTENVVKSNAWTYTDDRECWCILMPLFCSDKFGQIGGQLDNVTQTVFVELLNLTSALCNGEL